MRALLQRFVRHKSGTVAIEYAMIGVIISIVIISAATTIGTRAAAPYAPVAEALQ